MELMAFSFNSMKFYEMKFQWNFRPVGLHCRPQGLHFRPQGEIQFQLKFHWIEIELKLNFIKLKLNWNWTRILNIVTIGLPYITYSFFWNEIMARLSHATYFAHFLDSKWFKIVLLSASVSKLKVNGRMKNWRKVIDLTTHFWITVHC